MSVDDNIYIYIYIYKQDLLLNNPLGLICHRKNKKQKQKQNLTQTVQESPFENFYGT